MCLRIQTGKSTHACSEFERLRAAIAEADAVVVGAGAGLSAAAGFAYSGARFADRSIVIADDIDAVLTAAAAQ